MSNTSKNRIRMDRSKYFSTIHGERQPGDEHRHAHFAQDGLFFDASGHLILELVPEDKKAAVEARLRKMNKTTGEKRAVPSVPADAADQTDDSDPDDDDEDDEAGAGDDASDPSSNSDDVNLESWLRGEQQVQWFKVAAAIRDRFKKQVANAADAVVFLVEQGVVPADQVGGKLKKYLG